MQSNTVQATPKVGDSAPSLSLPRSLFIMTLTTSTSVDGSGDARRWVTNTS